jgi:hypothetical protein
MPYRTLKIQSPGPHVLGKSISKFVLSHIPFGTFNILSLLPSLKGWPLSVSVFRAGWHGWTIRSHL